MQAWGLRSRQFTPEPSHLVARIDSYRRWRYCWHPRPTHRCPNWVQQEPILLRARCFHGPDLEGAVTGSPGRDTRLEIGVVRGWPVLSSPPEAQPPWDPSHLPKFLRLPAPSAPLLPEPGRRHFSGSAFSLSPLLRPRQRFIPGPRLLALGAGRAQGGADGPIMDRAAAPPGPVPPEPHHPSGAAGAGVSANEAEPLPLGASQPHHTGSAPAFGFSRAELSPSVAVGKARGVGLLPSPAALLRISAVFRLDAVRGVAGVRLVPRLQ